MTILHSPASLHSKPDATKNGHLIWIFAGSEGGGNAMAIAYTLIETTKLKNVDPQAWLTWALARIADQKIARLDELLP